jgi:transglutaminase/protease-like cytokinesis protein 3
MKKIFFLILYSFSAALFGQNNEANVLIDKKIDAIPENLNSSTTSISEYISSNFKSDYDKIRAVFYWTSSNISYDIERLKELKKTNLTEKEKIATTLKSKKGVCENYSLIFNEIATLLGLKSFQIQGYTKNS